MIMDPLIQSPSQLPPEEDTPVSQRNILPQTVKARAIEDAANVQVWDGWRQMADGWAYLSADAPNYVVNVQADVTATYAVGQKVKFTQTTTQYGIIVAVGSFASGVTPVTIYCGTDYSVANNAIYTPYISTIQSPLGFPQDPAKWTVTTTSTADVTQVNPAQNTWYNVGTLTISIPIGCWNVFYQGNAFSDAAGAADLSANATLSTANNTASDVTMTSWTATKGVTGQGGILMRSRFLTLTTKTTYYLNMRTVYASATSVQWLGSTVGSTVIKAVSCYL